MKATGIIRRIDDLGRVVIPKEIRKNLHLKEGDPLELSTMEQNGTAYLCMSKYVPCDPAEKLINYKQSLLQEMTEWDNPASAADARIVNDAFNIIEEVIKNNFLKNNA